VASKIDLEVMKYLLAWVGGTVGVLLIVLIIAMAFWFVLKLAVDFKNRNARFVLNPGSRQPSDDRNPLAEQAVSGNRR
jgi:hypothetical protein